MAEHCEPAPAAALQLAMPLPAADVPALTWRYGLLGLPLAFMSLPLYVSLPQYYAEHFGVPLGVLGVVLLASRLLDAAIDPWLGRWADSLFARSAHRAWAAACAAAVLMALGFAALWHPLLSEVLPMPLWLAAALVPTYLGFSVVSVIHMAWGARWGGTAAQRARIVAWREGLALCGVVAASVLPSWLGMAATSAVLAAALALGLAMLKLSSGGVQRAAGAPAQASSAGGDARSSPWASAPFKALLGVFMLNGVSAAIPATLLPFYVRDQLQAPAWEPLFLLAYFACAASGLPLWLRLVPRLGLVRSWLLGMLLAVLAFAAVPWLEAGQVLSFTAVCLASGLALGADLVMPAALLVAVLRDAGQGAHGEGRFFGWWACATKLNLALAAGLALPLLAWVGYTNGSREPRELAALVGAYAALPCVLKLMAALALWRAGRRHAVLMS